MTLIGGPPPYSADTVASATRHGNRQRGNNRVSLHSAKSEAAVRLVFHGNTCLTHRRPWPRHTYENLIMGTGTRKKSKGWNHRRKPRFVCNTRSAATQTARMHARVSRTMRGSARGSHSPRKPPPTYFEHGRKFLGFPLALVALETVCRGIYHRLQLSTGKQKKPKMVAKRNWWKEQTRMSVLSVVVYVHL